MRGVHAEAVALHHLAERREVARRRRPRRAASRSAGVRRHPGLVQRRGLRGRAPCRRAERRPWRPRSSPPRPGGRPTPSGASELVRDGVGAVGACARRHLDEAAEDRARGRARAAPRERRQLRGRELEAEAAAAAAAASAAKPDADEASPAAVGKELRRSPRARALARRRAARTRSRKRATRAERRPRCDAPSSSKGSRRSAGVERDAWCASTSPASVSERLPVRGRLSAASRLPQYLTSAMLVPARARRAVPSTAVIRPTSATKPRTRRRATRRAPPPRGPGRAR